MQYLKLKIWQCRFRISIQIRDAVKKYHNSWGKVGNTFTWIVSYLHDIFCHTSTLTLIGPTSMISSGLYLHWHGLCPTSMISSVLYLHWHGLCPTPWHLLSYIDTDMNATYLHDLPQPPPVITLPAELCASRELRTVDRKIAESTHWGCCIHRRLVIVVQHNFCAAVSGGMSDYPT